MTSRSDPTGQTGEAALGSEITRLGRWLCELYALDLELDAEQFLLSPGQASELLPESGPRTGVLAREEADELQLGLYVDPEDQGDPWTLLEETSHLVCLAWHGSRDLPVSGLLLELQADIDCFLYGCHEAGRLGSEGFACFETRSWAAWTDADSRVRYVAARHRARRYCRGLVARFSRPADLPRLSSELRRFYRASPAAKLRV
jgi:hypothetical protein